MDWRLIASSDLTLDDLPPPRCDWSDIVSFASTFDLKTEADVIDKDACHGVESVHAASSVPSLRAALYGEWRRYNHRSDKPDSKLHEKAWCIVEWIRRDVARRHNV